MSTGAPKTVLAKRMDRIFRHGEVEYAIEFDHYLEGFKRSKKIQYRDQEFIGMTSAGL
jgi:hypothetical protein